MPRGPSPRDDGEWDAASNDDRAVTAEPLPEHSAPAVTSGAQMELDGFEEEMPPATK